MTTHFSATCDHCQAVIPDGHGLDLRMRKQGSVIGQCCDACALLVFPSLVGPVQVFEGKVREGA